MRFNFIMPRRHDSMPTIADQIVAHQGWENRLRNKHNNLDAFGKQGAAICTLCGEYLDVVTHAHAQIRHGMPDKYALIDSGYLRWL